VSVFMLCFFSFPYSLFFFTSVLPVSVCVVLCSLFVCYHTQAKKSTIENRIDSRIDDVFSL